MFRRVYFMAVEYTLKWVYLLQDTLFDILLETFGSIF